jgi:hypothetical protein
MRDVGPVGAGASPVTVPDCGVLSVVVIAQTRFLS